MRAFSCLSVVCSFDYVVYKLFLSRFKGLLEVDRPNGAVAVIMLHFIIDPSNIYISPEHIRSPLTLSISVFYLYEAYTFRIILSHSISVTVFSSRRLERPLFPTL